MFPDTAAGAEIPTVTVEYNNINIDADALVGSASIPSLTNVALGILKVWYGYKLCSGS